MGIIYKNGIAYGDQPSTDAVAMIEPSEEASATSAHAYAVGEHFIYNGTLYRATAAIAIGDTITPNTNCVATNVMTEVESGGGGGGSEKLNSTQAADAYDPTATYAVGDKVSYAGNVYSCISAISTPEAWDSTHWDQVDPIQDQVDDVRNTLNSKADQSDLASLNLTGTTNTTGSQINAGTYFYLNGALVKAKVDIASGATFTSGTNYEAVTVGEEVSKKKYIKHNFNTTEITTSDGTLFNGSFAYLAYNEDSVFFNARILLKNLTADTRPEINITHSDLVNCPSFHCVGNPVLRGAVGNYTDECYARHEYGFNNIIIRQQNFLSASLAAGYGIYQIPGTVPI